MKKTLTFLTTLFALSIVEAQTFVNTTAENKNIILEEFTGIYCGFCPDGHVKGQQLYDNNPGDVVLINIHTGSYANPNSGDPDFRTSFGSAIAGQAGISGYPAGTVNRHAFGTWSQQGGTAMSRGDWDDAGNVILNDSSYVNVEAQATLDISTRELSVIVEAYYTGNSPQAANKLNVVLLQNNIEGPQSGGATYNPSAILPNGNYNHQHMLRHLITGQWGDDINTTTSGHFFTNTYTYTIPASLNNIPYDLFNLDVAVFISEGNQEIITGNMASMTHIVPPGINLIDLEASSNMSLPANYCDNNITPEITIQNNSQIAVDTFEVSYSLNGGSPVSQQVNTSLGAGLSTTITFSNITAPSGTNNISYNVSTVGGTSFIDNFSSNNTASSGSFNLLSATAFDTEHTEGFESYAVQTAILNNGIIENPNNANTYVVDNNISSSVTWPLGGYGMSAKSYRFRFYSGWNNGDQVKLIWENLDFTGTNNNTLTFDFAHALQNSWDADRLQILVSTDCGLSWITIDELIGANLATISATNNSSFYYPTPNDWATHNVDLSSFDGNPEVMIALNAICGGGNNLYIDNIDINGEVPSGINYSTNILSIHPNPAKDFIYIEGDYKHVEIFDLTGKILLEKRNETIINTSHISEGAYFIRIKTGEGSITRKIVITP